MRPNISWRDATLAVVAGACVVLGFVPFHIAPLIFLYPVFLNLFTLGRRTFPSGFAYGFLMSFIVNAGGFYWMIFTIHEFGYLPYWIATLIFLLFCGFGSLNVPLFAGLASMLHARGRIEARPPLFHALWFTLGLPALFTLPEFFIPKLFPVYYGHAFYWLPVMNQIAEVTGCTFLSFSVYSAGGFLTLLWLTRRKWKLHPAGIAIPVALWILILAFGVRRLSGPEPDGNRIQVALVQANIGSLEKAAAEGGVRKLVRKIVDRYRDLTDQAMNHDPRPQLVVWPETAMPFQLEGNGALATEVFGNVKRWSVPLITGAYAPEPGNPRRDYNGAYLLIPDGNEIRKDVYGKNILLAFGEYFPGGEMFPKLYEWFPQVSDFARGAEQNAFTLPDGTRIGVTICYEAIVPSFYRKVARSGVHAVVNLTNDSWFGPTSEPYHHAALATFRAIETRVPLIRVTNTGVSLVVDDRGRMSPMTGVYREGVLHHEVRLPRTPPQTFYLKYGDWFIIVCAALLAWLGIPLYRGGPSKERA